MLESVPGQVAAGQNWRFRAWSYGGALHVDTYAELKLLAESETKTDATQTASWSRTSPSGKPLLGLAAYWQRPVYEKRLLFNGDALFTGALTEYEYQTADQNGAQYGNRTRLIEKGWNGSSFVAYRATRRLFYPNDGANVYLVGLVGHEGVYTCPGGSCGYGDTNVQQVRWLVYDSNSWYNQLPTQGKLTRMRTLVCYATAATQCVGASGAWTRKLFSDALLSYDAYGNLTSHTVYPGYGYQEGATLVYPTANGRTTSYTYADGGHNTYRTSEQNPAGHTTSWLYAYRLGVPTQETDANGIVTTAEYDAFGRLVKIIRPGDTSAVPTVWVKYLGPGAANNQPFFISLSGPHQGGTWVQRKVYDGLGNLLQTQVGNAQVSGTANDIIVDYQYNGYGQVVKQTVPYLIGTWNGSGSAYRGQQLGAQPTVTSYDGLGRLTRVQSPTAAEYTAYSYPSDLQVQVCDGRTNCTTTTHDLWGRVAEVRPALDPWLKYSYDEVGRLASVEKRTGTGAGTLFASTSMTYDLAGRKRTLTDPDLGAWSYASDALGNLLSQTDARLCRTTLTYDALSRVTQKSYAALSGGACGATTATITYGYDAFSAGSNLGKGQRTSMSDGSGSTTWTYGDARGRLTRESKTITGGGAFVTQWSYDSADQVVTLTYPDGEVVNYTYLPQRLVNSVSGSATYVQASYYDGAGRLSERRLGADQVRLKPIYHGWDSQGGRLAQLRAGTPANYLSNPPGLQWLVYNYDAASNVLSIVDNKADGGTQTQSFSYDALDRLVSASASGGTGGTYSESYSYQANGRLASGPLGASYSYDDLTHAHAVTAVGSHSFSYDANGNMTGRTLAGSGVSTLTYDAENRLVSMSGAATASFVYDGDGQRVKGTAGGVTTYYVGKQYEVAGGTVKKYYDAGGTRVAMRSGGTLYWLLGDHLGSTSYTVSGTSETGEVRYKAFGTNRFSSGTAPTTYRYTGQREEAGLGLYYYGARWYDPALGRFIQADTIIPHPDDARAYDRYAYVLNNPLKYVDPTGHAAGPAVHDSNSGSSADSNSPYFLLQECGIYDFSCITTNVGQWLLDNPTYDPSTDPFFGVTPSYDSVLQMLAQIHLDKGDKQKAGIYLGMLHQGLAEQGIVDGSISAAYGGTQILGAGIALRWLSGASVSSRGAGTKLASIAKGHYVTLRRAGLATGGVSTAVTEVNGKLYVAVYGSTEAATTIQNAMGSSGQVVSYGTVHHAEVQLYNWLQVNQMEFEAIGVSNYRGPCASCTNTFTSEYHYYNVYWDKTYVK